MLTNLVYFKTLRLFLGTKENAGRALTENRWVESLTRMASLTKQVAGYVELKRRCSEK